jgi:hypothetical protein
MVNSSLAKAHPALRFRSIFANMPRTTFQEPMFLLPSPSVSSTGAAHPGAGEPLLHCVCCLLWNTRAAVNSSE